MAPGVSFERIARGTSGFSGAQLANLVNEAALLAARKGLKEITEAELEEARDKVSWGVNAAAWRLTNGGAALPPCMRRGMPSAC